VIARWWRGLDRLGRRIVLSGAATAGVGIVALVHWWDTYWGQWVAGNVLPPSLWTLVGIAIAHLQLHRKLDAHHEALKQHVTERTGQ
jgi:hypothetical protein